MKKIPSSTKVVVIGGGVVGCSCAYHLAKFGWKDVILLERDKLTSGTTWHAAGLVSQLGPSATITKIRKYSLDLYKDYENTADLILFDSTSMEKSQNIPKDLLVKLPKGEKFGLAGAINLQNIQEYSQLGFNFLDLSSGLERENLKGYKDHLKIKNFINKVNELKN